MPTQVILADWRALVIGVAALDAEVIADRVEFFLVALADRVDLGIGVALIDRDELGSETETDDRDFNGLRHIFLWGADLGWV